jgi:hypothetical protein
MTRLNEPMAAPFPAQQGTLKEFLSQPIWKALSEPFPPAVTFLALGCDDAIMPSRTPEERRH